jgi:hypothetical protein
MDDLAAFVTARLDEGGLPPRVTEALRAILAAYQDSAEGSVVRDVLGFAVITYASIWDHHPGYRQDWRRR